MRELVHAVLLAADEPRLIEEPVERRRHLSDDPFRVLLVEESDDLAPALALAAALDHVRARQRE